MLLCSSVLHDDNYLSLNPSLGRADRPFTTRVAVHSPAPLYSVCRSVLEQNIGS